MGRSSPGRELASEHGRCYHHWDSQVARGVRAEIGLGQRYGHLGLAGLGEGIVVRARARRGCGQLGQLAGRTEGGRWEERGAGVRLERHGACEKERGGGGWADVI